MATTASATGTLKFEPDKDIGNLAKRIRENPVADDGDIARKLIDMRDLAQATAAVMDIGADAIFTALWKYDKGKKVLSARRPHKVVAPIRHFSSGMRFAHRFMMKSLRTYQKEYAEDIVQENAAKSKSTFKPGRR